MEGTSSRCRDRRLAKPVVTNAAGSYVVSVKPLEKPEWVYCINVPGVKEFVLASGHVVHNSEDHAADALRYLAVHVFGPQQGA